MTPGVCPSRQKPPRVGQGGGSKRNRVLTILQSQRQDSVSKLLCFGTLEHGKYKLTLNPGFAVFKNGTPALQRSDVEKAT